MTTKSYKAPPPPYTPRLPTHSERVPLLPKALGDQVLDLGSAEERIGRRIGSALTSILILVLIFFGIYQVSLLYGGTEQAYPEIKIVNFKVGIVGAGPAGIAAAQGVRDSINVLALHEKLKDRNIDVQVEIIIYEEKQRVGGRMVVDGTSRMKIEVEDLAGGALNRDLLDIIGGTEDPKKKEAMAAETRDIGMGKVGYFNATDIITETYRPTGTTPWSHYLSLILKYGPSIWRAPKIPIGTMETFNTFLHTMNNGESCITSVGQMIDILSRRYTFVPFSVPATERLEKNGIGGSYTRDILSPQVRRHTGQPIAQISDLALSMVLEREGMGSQRTVDNGIFEMMMERSLKDSEVRLQRGAKITKARWEEVMDDYETWVIQWENLSNKDQPPNAEVLDKIIIAAPSNYTELFGKSMGSRLSGSIFSPALDTIQNIGYQPLYITFFQTTHLPLTSTFLKPGGPGPLPAQLLSIIDSSQAPNSTFNSIIELSLLRTTTDPPQDTSSTKYLYRLLSSSPIHYTSLAASLGFQHNVIEDWTQQKIPYAYPVMQPWLPKDIRGDFQLGPNVWTTNGAEGILGSSVSLAWNVGRLVGRNVGRQIVGEVEEKLRQNEERLRKANEKNEQRLRQAEEEAEYLRKEEDKHLQ